MQLLTKWVAMKKQDIFLILICGAVLLPFFLFPSVYDAYSRLNANHGILMAFAKFAILSTLGECIGLRIKTGKYNYPGFGILPRALVWGFLGMWIAAAMKIFGAGAPRFAEYLGISGVVEAMGGGFSGLKVLGAFFISLAMNTTFAPVFMTLHKVTDTHILNTGGTIKGLFKPINVAGILSSLNWNVQWNFVFKKTIPFFWIPAHTLTFILPTNLQVLFAALLGVALGVILAVASQKK